MDALREHPVNTQQVIYGAVNTCCCTAAPSGAAARALHCPAAAAAAASLRHVKLVIHQLLHRLMVHSFDALKRV